jgi:hypothetical protein
LSFVACSDRPQSHSDAGRRFAEHLCAVQDGCGCADDLIISNCETEVEHEFAESEHKALNAGLVYDTECEAVFLENIDALGACGMAYIDYGPACPVYGANHDVGEPCETFALIPGMYGCRVGLECFQGICRDLENPAILPQGEICSVEQATLPTPWLGTCDEGLQCDSLDTRMCIPSTSDPAPLGGECTHPYECLDGNICKPQGDDLQPSEDRPGICVERTPPGEPCTLAYECDRFCAAGRCEIPPPVLCDALRDWWALRDMQET